MYHFKCSFKASLSMNETMQINSKSIMLKLLISECADTKYHIEQSVKMKCKYRMRWFSSKGALLVLLWTACINFFCPFFTSLYSLLKSGIPHLSNLPTTLKLLLSIPFLVGFVSAPLSGWLADAKFGNYKVFRVGVVLLFIATVINCLFLILKAQNLKINNVQMWTHLCLVYCFLVSGASACVVTALPLGLDQMPDASSSSIESYIAWFICSIYIDIFISEGLEHLGRKCMDEAIYTSYTVEPLLAATPEEQPNSL